MMINREYQQFIGQVLHFIDNDIPTAWNNPLPSAGIKTRVAQAGKDEQRFNAREQTIDHSIRRCRRIFGDPLMNIADISKRSVIEDQAHDSITGLLVAE